MPNTTKRLHFIVLFIISCVVTMYARPGSAKEDITQCFGMSGPLFPPSVTKGEEFIFPGALVLHDPSELHEHDPKLDTPAFRTTQDDRIIALESMRDRCGVHIEGWVWIPRLGRRYLTYWAF